jgi:hypothetical protein
MLRRYLLAKIEEKMGKSARNMFLAFNSSSTRTSARYGNAVTELRLPQISQIWFTREYQAGKAFFLPFQDACLN